MSRLLNNSENFRTSNIVRNIYDKEDNYNVSNTRAKSDGDEFGKGENNGSIGSVTDIAKRNELQTKNLYNKNNEYGIGNA